MQTTTPQTVSFVAVIDYRSFERMNEGLPEQIKYEFDVFEEMIMFFKKERKRRAYKDRATSGRYRMKLTELGEKVCAECTETRKRHQEAIEGTYFSL